MRNLSFPILKHRLNWKQSYCCHCSILQMPSYKTAGWREWKCKGIAPVNVQEHEDLSMQAHTPDVQKITIRAMSWYCQARVLAGIWEMQTLARFVDMKTWVINVINTRGKNGTGNVNSLVLGWNENLGWNEVGKVREGGYVELDGAQFLRVERTLSRKNWNVPGGEEDVCKLARGTVHPAWGRQAVHYLSSQRRFCLTGPTGTT